MRLERVIVLLLAIGVVVGIWLERKDVVLLLPVLGFALGSLLSRG